MSNYYYIVASLPMLIVSEKPSITVKEFISSCKDGLTPNDFISIEELTKTEPQFNKLSRLGKEYISWNNSLKNSLVSLRSVEKKIDQTKYLRDNDVVSGVTEVAAEAMKFDSPLEAELSLDKARWNFVDNLSAGHIFDMDALTAYLIKLQIAERASKFIVEIGASKYKDVYNNIIEQNTGDINE